MNQSSDPNPGMTKILELLESFKMTIIMLKDLMEKVNMCEQMGNFNRDGNTETTGNARNEKCSMRRNF